LTTIKAVIARMPARSFFPTPIISPAADRRIQQDNKCHLHYLD
jgi:hypothetical protein